MTIDLGIRDGQATVWGCDLTTRQRSIMMRRVRQVRATCRRLCVQGVQKEAACKRNA